AWWNKLAPDVRGFLEESFKELTDKQWQFGGVEFTQDGIDCNANRPSCKIGSPAKDTPVGEGKATDADKALLKKVLAESVLPAWGKRCGSPCGDIHNGDVPPIA